MDKQRSFAFALPIVAAALVFAAMGCGGDIADETGVPNKPFSRDDFTVGDPVPVVTKAQRDAKGLLYWPDGPMGAINEGNGTYVFYASGVEGSQRGRMAMTVGTLDNPAGDGSATIVTISNIKGERNFAYLAGGQVYKLDENTLLLFYHTETPTGPILPDGGRRSYNEIGAAVSTAKDSNNRFTSFRDLGIVLSPTEPYNENADCYGMEGWYTVHDGYLYCYFEDDPGDPNDPNYQIELAVARASLDEIKAAVNEDRAPVFRKYYNGGFTEPGRNGKSSPLERGNPNTWGIDVSYNTYLNKFLMILGQWEFDGPDLYLMVSDDGINWSDRYLIANDDGELYMPSTVGGPEVGQRETGKEFYVYYVRSSIGVTNGGARWGDAELVRRTITLH